MGMLVNADVISLSLFTLFLYLVARLVLTMWTSLSRSCSLPTTVKCTGCSKKVSSKVVCYQFLGILKRNFTHLGLLHTYYLFIPAKVGRAAFNSLLINSLTVASYRNFGEKTSWFCTFKRCKQSSQSLISYRIYWQFFTKSEIRRWTQAGDLGQLNCHQQGCWKLHWEIKCMCESWRRTLRILSHWQIVYYVVRMIAFFSATHSAAWEHEKWRCRYRKIQ